jgi:iron uptake system component EfeO
VERKQWLVVLLAGLIGMGLALAVGACGEDKGSVNVQDAGTGTAGTSAGTSTTPLTVDTTASDPEQLDAAMAIVTKYGREQTHELIGATEKLQSAIDAGDVPAAKQAYAAARPYYERIEPLVAVFPELDGKIDAREDAFPRKAEDPKWIGFHPIERALYRDGKITPETRTFAAGLVENSKTLHADLERETVTPEVVIPGTAELVDEVEESKITGEEERYSKLDIPTFVANLEGAETFFEALEPVVESKDLKLAEQIKTAFGNAAKTVDGLKKNGRYPPYDELTDAQKKQVKQSIEALAEPLARVQGVLGVES